VKVFPVTHKLLVSELTSAARNDHYELRNTSMVVTLSPLLLIPYHSRLRSLRPFSF